MLQHKYNACWVHEATLLITNDELPVWQRIGDKPSSISSEACREGIRSLSLMTSAMVCIRPTHHTLECREDIADVSERVVSRAARKAASYSAVMTGLPAYAHIVRHTRRGRRRGVGKKSLTDSM